MPVRYQRCVRKVKAKGHSTGSAHAICTKVNAGKIRQYRKSGKK